MRRVIVSYSRPIRFVILDSEHVQSDGKSENRGLPMLDQGGKKRPGWTRERHLVLTKRSAASGDESFREAFTFTGAFSITKRYVLSDGMQ